MIPAPSNIFAQIEQLSAQNRRECSDRREAQLLKLRQRAALELRARASVSAPRTSAPDVFAGNRGVPEIDVQALTGDTLAAGILNHGVLLVRGLFSSGQLERLRDVLDPPLAVSQPQAAEIPEPEAPGLGCTPHVLFELLELYRDCGLLSVIRQYLGEEPLLFGERTKLRRHRAGHDRYAAIPWHQDVNFFGAQAWAVNCWAAVTPCGESNPGDALLFDEMTLHGTAQKPWELEQQVVTISWFFAPSRFPDWGTPLVAHA